MRSFAADAGIATDPSAFMAEIERLMEERGIADWRELYERFTEPERIGRTRWTFGRFCQHASANVEYIYARFMVPLAEALEADDGERFRLAYARTWGCLPVRA